jgi:hypothetical protein
MSTRDEKEKTKSTTAESTCLFSVVSQQLETKSGKSEESRRALSMRVKQEKNKVKDRTLCQTKPQGVR